MKILVLAPPKVLQRWSENELKKIGLQNIQLVTSECNESDKSILHKQLGNYADDIFYIENYNTSGLHPILVSDLIEKYQITHIIALSEVDVMRAARLREKFDLPGITSQSAIYFRDKHLMKQLVSKAGILCAQSHLVYDPLSLQQIIQEMGYPVVLKPTMGRGSSGVEVIENEGDLLSYLKTYCWNDMGCQMSMLLEKYVEGNLYRVDGVISQGEMCFVAAARYWGTHLNYLHGGCLGSILLDPESETSKKLVNMTKQLLLEVLPFGKNGGFHVEIFINQQGQLIFNEAAARLGGGSIIEEIETAYGVNIKTLTVAAEAENYSVVSDLLNNANDIYQPAAQLHISPRLGELVYIPESCPLDGVALYEPMGSSGKHYDLMNHTNAEVARFILTRADELQLTQLLGQVMSWFNNETQWIE